MDNVRKFPTRHYIRNKYFVHLTFIHYNAYKTILIGKNSQIRVPCEVSEKYVKYHKYLYWQHNPQTINAIFCPVDFHPLSIEYFFVKSQNFVAVCQF